MAPAPLTTEALARLIGPTEFEAEPRAVVRVRGNLGTAADAVSAEVDSDGFLSLTVAGAIEPVLTLSEPSGAVDEGLANLTSVPHETVLETTFGDEEAALAFEAVGRAVARLTLALRAAQRKPGEGVGTASGLLIGIGQSLGEAAIDDEVSAYSAVLAAAPERSDEDRRPRRGDSEAVPA